MTIQVDGKTMSFAADQLEDGYAWLKSMCMFGKGGGVVGVGRIPQLADVVDLSGRELDDIPFSLYNSTSCEVLNLSNNMLESVSGFVGNVATLKTLNLANNKLTALPGSIGGLSNLRDVNLYGNSFVTVPQCLSTLSLSVLNIGKNNISEVLVVLVILIIGA